LLISYEQLNGFTWSNLAWKVLIKLVVATTRLMSNSSTTSKSLRQISSREHKLCNSQENSTGNHNSILPTIYIKYPWSMLRLCICCTFYSNIHVLFLCPLLIYHVFISRLVCHIHVLQRHTLNPILYFYCSCVHHVYTMRKSCSLTLLYF